MSSSKLPGAPGETPVKVVFPGSTQEGAEQLYAQNMGAIGQFQVKARQSREISGQPQAAMQGTLPGGGRIRSVYNNGQETLYVDIPHERVTLPERVTIPEPKPCDVLLAIDVVFNPKKFLAGDINNYSEETITPDPIPTGSWPVEGFIEDLAPRTFDAAAAGAEFPNGGAVYTLQSTHLLGLARTYGPDGNVNHSSGHFNFTVNNLSEIDFLQPGFPGTESDLSIAGEAWEYQIWLGDPNNPDYDNFYLIFSTREAHRPVQPGPYTVTHTTRDVRTYLDILPVVGLRIEGEKDKPDKTALSVGDHAQESDALQALVDGERTTVQRAIAWSDPEGGNHFYGASFTAKLTLLPNQQLKDVAIEVYLASGNIIQRNQPLKSHSSQFGVDDETMSWSATTETEFTLRVREITDASVPPYVVKVSVDAEGETKLFVDGSEQAPTYDAAARHLDWWFTAESPDWAPGGGEPADPAAPKMGMLLAHTDDRAVTIIKTDAILQRQMLDHPVWGLAVTDMTHVSTITWKPPSACHIHGSASIEDFSDGNISPPDDDTSEPVIS